MEVRYSVNPEDFKRYTTEEIRREFLAENLYQKDAVISVYSHVDRVVTLGCMPVDECVNLEKGMDVWKCFGTKFFLQRRELGIFNIGGAGSIIVDGVVYSMNYRDCIYITMGTKEILFCSENPSEPAKFFMASAPAHKACKTTHIPLEKAGKRTVGSADTCNERVVYQFIHCNVLETCQLMMGLTALAPGSVWNTMPPHTHERRMEVYTYFEMDQNQRVFHMMGQPDQTRQVVMKAEDAIISPSWSVHSGCGTSNYTMIWAMAGENQEYDDMDTCVVADMK